jgi:hypothetical protein
MDGTLRARIGRVSVSEILSARDEGREKSDDQES